MNKEEFKKKLIDDLMYDLDRYEKKIAEAKMELELLGVKV